MLCSIFPFVVSRLCANLVCGKVTRNAFFSLKDKMESHSPNYRNMNEYCTLVDTLRAEIFEVHRVWCHYIYCHDVLWCILSRVCIPASHAVFLDRLWIQCYDSDKDKVTLLLNKWMNDLLLWMPLQYQTM